MSNSIISMGFLLISTSVITEFITPAKRGILLRKTPVSEYRQGNTFPTCSLGFLQICKNPRRNITDIPIDLCLFGPVF